MMTDKIDPTRLAELPSIMLKAGAHTDFSSGVCAMEMVSWLAQEPFSDHPECTCPVLGTFVRSWNDSLPDDRRTVLLAPFLPRLVGTRNLALEGRRATMAADWYIRTCTPAWLRLAGLTAQADTLEAMPEIVSFESVPSLHDTLGAIRETASAAWSAEGSAAESAARSAAESAARSAVWSAAESAARSAAGSALKPTVDALQQSALELLIRMIEVA
jgi:hypothetical protein